MKDFSPNSILNRMITELQKDTDWSQIINDGTVLSTFGSYSESASEIVRYLEYLFQETKWGHAQNISSLVSSGKYLSYNPQRKVSALSTTGLIVSHDPTLATAGVGIYTTSDVEAQLSGYTPTSGQPTLFSIKAGDTFTTSSSVVFFAIEDVPYTPIGVQGATNSIGTKYVRVPVIQGIQKTISTPTLGNVFEEIVIQSSNIESANNPFSAPFFKVKGQVTGSSTIIDFKKYDSIYEASADEYAFETELANDYSYLILRFGNGTAGKVIPSNCQVTISYIETLGSQGNINSNYVVNTILSSSAGIQLYCANIPESGSTTASILGGQDEDTAEEVRGKAPRAYLNGGAIITDGGYEVAITTPNIPYIQQATVYSGLVTDPITGVSQNVINYSAIQTDGSAPSETSFPVAVQSVVAGRTSPLDVLTYSPPDFLHVRFNVLGEAQANATNLATLSATIRDYLYGKLIISQQSFQSPMYSSALTSLVQTNYNLKDVKSITEAVVDLLPSNFIPDSLLPEYYYHNFSFDRSFQRLKNFNDGVLHCLKINLFFDCVECSYNGNSYSRTLFVVNDTTQNPSYTVTFLVDNASVGTMTVCGHTFSLNLSDVSSPVVLVNTIYGQSASITNYTLSIPSPGVLKIVPNDVNLAEPSVFFPTSGGALGITVSKQRTVDFKTIQFPYISNITSYEFMNDYVLKGGVSPTEILPGDTTTPYVPIKISLDYQTLNPPDLNASLLGSGKIQIPNYLFGSSGGSGESYINFLGGSSELDTKIRIQVIGQVYDNKILAYAKNNILQIKDNDLIDDVVVEIS